MLSKLERRKAEALEIESLGGVDYASALVNQILKEHGIERPMFTMSELAEFRVILEADKFGPILSYDLKKSVSGNMASLFRQLSESVASEARFVAEMALLQHLVTALLRTLRNDAGSNAFSLRWKTHSVNAFRTLLIADTCIHIAALPSCALMRRCARLKRGLRPLIVTTRESHAGACSLALLHGIQDRVDIFDASQFVATHLYTKRHYKNEGQMLTIKNFLACYNNIVKSCETKFGIPICIED